MNKKFNNIENLNISIMGLGYLGYSNVINFSSSGLIIIVALFSGIILMTIGITGVYIARIYEQSQERPRYIIKNIVKSTNKENN